MALNIDRSNTDQFYRYKMPRLVAKVEGSGNGIKTVVANITDIAKALDRPPSYPLKYFGYELGAQTSIDTKNDRYIVNGAHDAGRLQEMLDGFIKKFVLCKNCNNPETTLSVNVKKQLIKQTCAACGHSGLSDMKEKLSTYIVKNPPAEAGEYGEKTKGGKGKAAKGKKGEDKKENGKNGKSNGSSSPTAEVEKGFDVPPPVEDDDDDWGDTDEVDAPLPADDLSKKIQSMIVDADAEKTEGERLDIFFEFVKKQKATNKVTMDALKGEIDRLEIPSDKAVFLMAMALFDDNMLEQIAKYRMVFLPLTHENAKAQKYLIGGFESVVGQEHRDALMPKCMRILKELYDRDILEEEVLIDWFEKPSKKYQRVSKEVADEVRKKVTPFINWLKEAEAESESEDDDEADDSDDGIPIAKTPAPLAGGDVKGRKPTAPAPAVNGVNGKGKAHVEEEDDEDDVDIDAI